MLPYEDGFLQGVFFFQAPLSNLVCICGLFPVVTSLCLENIRLIKGYFL